jgi:hypothetical protein
MVSQPEALNTDQPPLFSRLWGSGFLSSSPRERDCAPAAIRCST